MFSVLHISDLHRSARQPISNDELISALVRDRDRYVAEDPVVPAPDAIIISGDVIQGVPLGTPDAQARLAEQYEEAEGFLDELTNRMLGGDRSRVVIVPGNHDIDWVTSRSAMELVGVEGAPADVLDALTQEGSKFRWSWKTRELYSIANDDLYKSRMDAFWGFVESFYSGVDGLLRVEPRSDANLFTLDGGRIGVAAFNSCDGNDCFAFHGAIPRSVVARAHLDLVGERTPFDLLLAVWHHSIEGPPYATDYMDVDIVRGMLGRGFRLGLYGHQHRAQATVQQVYLPGEEVMAVVSAGSLCAGNAALPPGVHRQYNVIEIADDYRSARVHVREMVVANLFGRAHLNNWGGRSFAELRWTATTNEVGRAVDTGAARVIATVDEAEAAFQAKEYGRTIGLLLEDRERLPEYGRQLLLHAAVEESNWALVVECATPPQTIEELVHLTNALAQRGDFERAREALSTHAGHLGLSAPQQEELATQIAGEEALRR